MLYFGGVPTDIEVRRLQDEFPKEALSHGTVITHDKVSELVNTSPRTNRYRAITLRWRKQTERDCGIIIGCIPEGFKVLDDHEKVSLSSSKLKTSGRMARRSYIVASRVDVNALTEQEKIVYDHNVKRSSAVLYVAKLQSKVALPDI